MDVFVGCVDRVLQIRLYKLLHAMRLLPRPLRRIGSAISRRLNKPSNPVDDINDLVFDNPLEQKLNLACGHVILGADQGWVNLDCFAAPGVDVVARVPPIPFRDNSFDHIMASHFLEHVPAGRPIIELMNECWRVLRQGGKMHVEVPYWGSEAYVRDPTHVQPWNADKFRYFTSEFAYLNYGIRVWSSVTALRKGWRVVATMIK